MLKEIINDEKISKVVEDVHDKVIHSGYEGTDHDKHAMLDETTTTSSFDIDRDQEDADILAYQKTGDVEYLNKVFVARIPTLRYWAYKHYYPGLTDSIHDFYGHLVCVFVKAAQKYDSQRGAFNTCLYTFLLNRIKNIKNSKYAKKRISEEYDGPLNSMVLSLDYTYGNDGDSEKTLKDLIKSHGDFDGFSPLDKISLDDTLEILAEGNDILKEFFERLSKGGSMASLIKEYKIKSGKLRVNDGQVKQLRTRRATRIVTEMIKQRKALDADFKLVDYTLKGNTVNYTIEMKKTKETDLIMKSIRQLRNNKDLFLTKIVGTSQK